MGVRSIEASDESVCDRLGPRETGELGHALDLGRPVAGIETHDCSAFAGFEAVETPSEAVESVERRV